MTREVAKAIERRPPKYPGTTGRDVTAPLTKCCDGSRSTNEITEAPVFGVS